MGSLRKNRERHRRWFPVLVVLVFTWVCILLANSAWTDEGVPQEREINSLGDRHERTLAYCVAELAGVYGAAEYRDLSPEAIINHARYWFPARETGAGELRPANVTVDIAGRLLRIYGVPVCCRQDESEEFATWLMSFLELPMPVLLDVNSPRGDQAVLAIAWKPSEDEPVITILDPESGRYDVSLHAEPTNAFRYSLMENDGSKSWIRSGIGVPMQSIVRTSNWGQATVSTVTGEALPRSTPHQQELRAVASFLPPDNAYTYYGIHDAPGNSGGFMTSELSRALVDYRMIPADALKTDVLKRMRFLPCHNGSLLTYEKHDTAVEILDLIGIAKWAQSDRSKDPSLIADLSDEIPQNASEFAYRISHLAGISFLDVNALLHLIGQGDPPQKEKIKQGLMYSLGVMRANEIRTEHEELIAILNNPGVHEIFGNLLENGPSTVTKESWKILKDPLTRFKVWSAVNDATRSLGFSTYRQLAVSGKAMRSWERFANYMTNNDFIVRGGKIVSNSKIAAGASAVIGTGLDVLFVAWSAADAFNGWPDWAKTTLINLERSLQSTVDTESDEYHDFVRAISETISDIKSLKAPFNVALDNFINSGQFLETCVDATILTVISMVIPAVASTIAPLPGGSLVAIGCIFGMTVATLAFEDLETKHWLERTEGCIAGSDILESLIAGDLRSRAARADASDEVLKGYKAAIVLYGTLVIGAEACLSKAYRIVQGREFVILDIDLRAISPALNQSALIKEQADQYEAEVTAYARKLRLFKDPPLLDLVQWYWLDDIPGHCNDSYDFPPRIIATQPHDRETMVFPKTDITADFNLELDPASIDPQSVILIETKSNMPIESIVSYSRHDRRITLAPSEPLAFETEYQVAAAKTIASKYGIAMGRDTSWTFLTRRANQEQKNLGLDIGTAMMWSRLGEREIRGFWSLGAIYKDNTLLGWNGAFLTGGDESAQLGFGNIHAGYLIVRHAPVREAHYYGNFLRESQYYLEEVDLSLYVFGGMGYVSMKTPQKTGWQANGNDIFTSFESPFAVERARVHCGLGTIYHKKWIRAQTTIHVVSIGARDWAYEAHAYSGYGLTPYADVVMAVSLFDYPDWTSGGIGIGVQISL